jgi:polysaccharide export outer membrane protein
LLTIASQSEGFHFLFKALIATHRFIAIASALAVALGGCQSVGPSRGSVEKAAVNQTVPGLRVVPLTQDVVQQEVLSEDHESFARDLAGAEPSGLRVGVGDTLEVTIWEASPPALFGSPNLDPAIAGVPEGSRPNTLPGFVVGPSGTISIPFAGQVPAAGRTTHEIEQEIVRRLRGRAHLPQAIVRIARNVATTATVLGDVKEPGQVPLTPHGERVLDALSEAGGTSQPLDKMTVQITRGDIVRTMAVQDILTDPTNNVVLRSGDVVTASYQPYSFTVLGAAGKNAEIPFEATGITLSQALGRVGGITSGQADPKGVFLFRWQKPALPGAAAVPVIYQVDMKQPATYLAAQKFEMRNGDLLYVSNSPTTDLQQFVNIVASSILPFSTVRNITR